MGDDEGLSAFSACSRQAATSVAVAWAVDEREVYFELDGQANGFRTAKFSALLQKRTVTLTALRRRSTRPIEVTVMLPAAVDARRVRACLQSILSIEEVRWHARSRLCFAP